MIITINFVCGSTKSANKLEHFPTVICCFHFH